MSGWSEGERSTQKWVKAIDRGRGQHHADSDLIAALQTLQPPPPPPHTLKSSSPLLPAEDSARLLVSHLSPLRNCVIIRHVPVKYAAGVYKNTHTALKRGTSALQDVLRIILFSLLVFTCPAPVRPRFCTMLTNNLTAEGISGAKSIMGHVHCPCNGSAH